MITHTSDWHQIPSQNKAKSKLQIYKKKMPKNQILIENIHVKHFLKLQLLDKMYKYEMDIQPEL